MDRSTNTGYITDFITCVNRKVRQWKAGWLHLLFILVCCSAVGSLQAQELRDATLANGVLFGTPAFFGTDEPTRSNLYQREASVVTIPAYWRYTTRKTPAFNFKETDAAVKFAQRNGMEMHGHPLVWGADQHLPQWLLNRPASQGRKLMLAHIKRVVRRYRGRIGTWDVVNEAIDDQGLYRNSYWNRAMAGEFIATAFIEARRHDQSAVLLYNDYGMESNSDKFYAIRDMLQWSISLGADIDGVGWQLHVNADDVLAANGNPNPEFQLQARMQEFSDLGLANYVTELDVRVPDNSVGQLQRQRQAYEEIARIFLNNTTRGRYFQVWGLSDRYSWWNDFKPDNAPHNAHLISSTLEKKPAYHGLVKVFNTNQHDRKALQLQNIATKRYLNQSRESTGAPVTLVRWQEQKESMHWTLEPNELGEGYFRFRNSQGDRYLHTPADQHNVRVQVWGSNADWWSQIWRLEAVTADSYRIRNAWTGRYLAASGATVRDQNLNVRNRRQLWRIEAVPGLGM